MKITVRSCHGAESGDRSFDAFAGCLGHLGPAQILPPYTNHVLYCSPVLPFIVSPSLYPVAYASIHCPIFRNTLNSSPQSTTNLNKCQREEIVFLFPPFLPYSLIFLSDSGHLFFPTIQQMNEERGVDNHGYESYVAESARGAARRN